MQTRPWFVCTITLHKSITQLGRPCNTFPPVHRLPHNSQTPIPNVNPTSIADQRGRVFLDNGYHSRELRYTAETSDEWEVGDADEC
jgi:hypothetical protein